MQKETYYRLFRVISGGKGSSSVEHVESEGEYVQATLFPMQREHSLIFVCIPGVSDEDFLSLLETTKPAFVVDLRSVPRFDIGHLNRQVVFGYFQREQCTYLDPGENGRQEERLRGWLQPTAERLKNASRGPLMFLVSHSQDAVRLRRVVYDTLDCSAGDWQVFELPVVPLNAAITMKSI